MPRTEAAGKSKELVAEILDQAQEQLRQLMERCNGGGDALGSDLAMSTLVGVQRLIDRLDEFQATQAGVAAARKKVTKRRSRRQGRAPKSDAHEPRVNPEPVSAEGEAETSYPRYEQRGGVIYRIGWSDKQQKPYSERVLPAAVEQTVTVIELLAAGAPGGLEPDSVIEQVERSSGGDISRREVCIAVEMLVNSQALKMDPSGKLRVPGNVSEAAARLLGQGD